MVAVRVAIAGSSGSIGTQTLDVIAQSPDKFEVVALGVGSSVDVVVEQAKRWKPRVVVVTDEAARSKVAAQLPGVHISSDLADVVHTEVDAEANLELVRTLDIRSTPTTLFLDRNGHEVGRAMGAPKRDQVLSAISAIR